MISGCNRFPISITTSWCAWVYLRGENRNNYSMMQLNDGLLAFLFWCHSESIFFHIYVSYNLSSCASQHISHDTCRFSHAILHFFTFCYYYFHNCLLFFNRNIKLRGCFEPSELYVFFLWDIIKTIVHRRGTKRR